MAGQQLTDSVGKVMDGLVAGARADRDAAVNTLDAVNRQTKAARDAIARTVVVVPPPKAEDFGPAATAPAPGSERDDRFDPEDWVGGEPREHDVNSAPAAPAPTIRARHDDDEDDYPGNWLR